MALEWQSSKPFLKAFGKFYWSGPWNNFLRNKTHCFLKLLIILNSPHPAQPFLSNFYRPQTKFAKVMFLQVSVCPQGGHAWLLQGGMHGCSGGVCGCSGGHVWLLWGACVVAPGGACMVAPRGGMHGCSRGGVHGCSRGEGVHGFFDEIRSMSGRYASYWNAFLFLKIFKFQ